LDTCTDKVCYIRAYNALGFSEDTISLTVSPQGTPVLQGQEKNTAPRLLGIRRSEDWRVIFSVPSTAGIRAVSFELYDCKGAVVWSSRLDARGLRSGVQSIGIGSVSNRTTVDSGVYFLRMMSTGPSGKRDVTGTVRFTMVR
jgi:hypothetical protein